MKKLYSFLLTVALFVCVATSLKAQDEVILSAMSAIRSGDSKGLARHFSNLIELKIQSNTRKSNKDYSKTQAEYILEEFFRENPPQSFEYIHEGASREGNLRYAIGKYICRDKNNKATSFRVFMKIVQQPNGIFVIDAIDFSKDDPVETRN